MPQLDPTWFVSQLFWLLVAFVMLYTLLSRWALPGITGIIGQRQQTLEGDLSRADRLAKESERAREQYERSLSEARMNAQQLLNAAAATGKTKAEEAHKAMDAQITGMLKEAGDKITARKKDLMQQLTPASAEMAGLIVEKLTKQSLSQDKIQSVVSGALKSYGKR